MNEKQKARVAVVLANFFFGTSVIAVKHITPSLVPAIALTAIRVVSTTALLWLLFAMRPEKMNIERKDFKRLFFCAIAGITLNQTFAIRGMSLTSPIHASLLILATPIAITLLAAWFLKELLNLQKIIGLALGIAGGSLLVFSRDLSAQAGGDQTLGDMFVILGALSYSTYVVSIRPIVGKYKACIFCSGYSCSAVSSVCHWVGMQSPMCNGLHWTAPAGLHWCMLYWAPPSLPTSL
jgi:drug/metabolite transporter (DMT)-like permease